MTIFNACKHFKWPQTACSVDRMWPGKWAVKMKRTHLRLSLWLPTSSASSHVRGTEQSSESVIPGAISNINVSEFHCFLIAGVYSRLFTATLVVKWRWAVIFEDLKHHRPRQHTEGKNRRPCSWACGHRCLYKTQTSPSWSAGGAVTEALEHHPSQTCTTRFRVNLNVWPNPTLPCNLFQCMWILITKAPSCT